MNFIFYETCTPLVLFGYAFFWPIIAIACISAAFVQIKTIVVTVLGGAVASLVFLLCRALSFSTPFAPVP